MLGQSLQINFHLASSGVTPFVQTKNSAVWEPYLVRWEGGHLDRMQSIGEYRTCHKSHYSDCWLVRQGSLRLLIGCHECHHQEITQTQVPHPTCLRKNVTYLSFINNVTFVYPCLNMIMRVEFCCNMTFIALRKVYQKVFENIFFSQEIWWMSGEKLYKVQTWQDLPRNMFPNSLRQTFQ